MRKISSLFLCMLTGLVAAAAQITAEQAIQVAQQFINRKAATRGAVRAPMAKQMSACAVETDGSVMAYAVNMGDDDGFVLVGATHLTDEIVGYSDHGKFDVQNMPANMRAWLGSYMASAGSVADGGSQARMRRAAGRQSTKTYIAPLLNCRWGQSTPFNDQCPMIGTNHGATGCTITAFAQLMYYHRWPTAATKAIPSYTPDNSGGTHYPVLPALEPTTFDWDKIYPTYKKNEDGAEVARLFLYLGTASHANYGTETGATGYDAVQALIKYFGYDAHARTIWRRQQSYDEWVDMLYDELKAKRPVVFSGTAPDSGHSFVVDGYDEEDYFHVNWGWDGDSDGFYRVLLMDPKEQGTGGSESNSSFTLDQVAFFGVCPDAGQPAEPARLTVLSNRLKISSSQDDGEFNKTGSESTSPFYSNSGYLVFPSMDSFNFNGISAEFVLGSRLVKNDGSVTREYEWAPAKFTPNSGFNEHEYPIYLNPDTDPALVDGDYTLCFTSKVKGTDTWLLDDGSEDHYVKIHLDHAHGKLTAEAVSNEPKLKVNDIKFSTSTAMVGKPCRAVVALENIGTGAYHGDVGFFQKISDGYDWVCGVSCDVEPGKTTDVALSFVPKKAGTLTLYLYDNRGNTLKTVDVAIDENDATSDIDLTITHQVTNADGTEIIGPRALIDITVTNNSDMNYEGGINIHCFKWTGQKYQFVYNGKPATIPAHQTVVLHRESPDLTGAEQYSFTTMYMKGQQQIEQDADDKYYTVAPYYLTYDALGNASAYRATPNLRPDATVCAVDLAGTDDVVNIDTSANPNMIVLAKADSRLTGDNIVKDGQAENVKLIDGYPFFCPIAFNARHISYTRTPDVYYDMNASKGWTTLVLPFPATGCQTTIDGTVTPLKWHTAGVDEADILVGTFQYEEGNKMEFAVPATTLTSCHPYLLGIPSASAAGKPLAGLPITFYADNAEVKSEKASVTGRNYKMMGALWPVKDENNIYVLNAAGSAFEIGTHSVNPFHAFFVPIGMAAPVSELLINFIVDSPTGINEIAHHQPAGTQGVIYNLNGQRVSKPGKGIYIVDGKKVVF